MAWHTHTVGTVSGDSGVTTCGCEAGFTIKVVYGVSQKGSENWAFQSDATSSEIVSNIQHKRLAAEVSLCDVRRGEPTSSVCCKVGQVKGSVLWKRGIRAYWVAREQN